MFLAIFCAAFALYLRYLYNYLLSKVHRSYSYIGTGHDFEQRFKDTERPSEFILQNSIQVFTDMFHCRVPHAYLDSGDNEEVDKITLKRFVKVAMQRATCLPQVRLFAWWKHLHLNTPISITEGNSLFGGYFKVSIVTDQLIEITFTRQHIQGSITFTTKDTRTARQFFVQTTMWGRPRTYSGIYRWSHEMVTMWVMKTACDELTNISW